MKDNSILTAPVTTPTRRGWMRYFLAALALCSPVYVQAADETEAVAETVQTLTWTGDNGAIWKTGADASADSWDGNTAYVNGTSVSFDGTSATATADTRKVTIEGTVAPGSIDVDAGTIDTDYGVENFGVSGAVNTDAGINAQMLYGYAFEGGTIADYVDAEGNVKQTSITKTGDATLVLNSANSFTGGVTVNDGSLYLGAEGAAGTGTITLNTNADWDLYVNNGSNTFTKIADRKGAELIVNYNASTATVANAINLTGSDSGGQAHISYGYATYGDSATLPSTVTRNVQLTGGIYGSGDLYLHGYSHAIGTNTNMVSNFTINKDQASANDYDAFTGTVYLWNNFNRSNTEESASYPAYYSAGAVQLTLKDDVFAGAVVNMTRDTSSDKKIGWDMIFWDYDNPISSDNILLVDGSVQLSALEADFRTKTWVYGSALSSMSLQTIRQVNERWLVRVVASNATNTLTLDTQEGTYVFDGSVGFEQSYVEDNQSVIRTAQYDWLGSGYINNTFKQGSGSLGSAGMNLVKSGNSTQYIHTAKLNNLTHKQGTLGFNHLTLNGNLTMTGGATLKLGVAKDNITGWEEITGTDYNTNTALQFKEGQILSVAPSLTLNNQGQNVAGSVTSTIEGSITIESGATLDFNYLGSDLTKYGEVTTTEGGESYTTYTTPLLSITGNLTLAEGSNVTVSFPGLEYFLTADEYYLAQVTGTLSGNIANSSITLGHGYTGTISISGQYLILTLDGSNTRTWTGNVDGNNTWSAGGDTNVAGLWKENERYENGLTVLFGNTFSASNPKLPNVVNGNAAIKHRVGVEVDGDSITAQQVQISGVVTPGAVIINPSYYVGNTDGYPVIDATNYYFTGINNGAIGGEASVLKQGEGTAIFNLANTYTGGTTIEGGRLVMQNQGALGSGGVIIQNGATLQGDFDGMYIKNTITVKHNAGNTQAQDAVLRGRKDTQLTIADLDGAADTTLLLQGNASAAGKYGVFEVENATDFYGTVKLAGYLNGEGTGGNVQLQITSSSSGSTWTNATIDLSTTNANRTVLALNPNVQQNAVVQLSALQGTGTNSSVVNMVDGTTAVTLEFLGTQVGVYQGALGYGDYQKSDGTPGHDMREGRPSFNVTKKGNSSQTVRSAWLNTLTIAAGGDRFIVTDDLVVETINVAHGTHLVIGNPEDTSYGLNVGAGGILAITGSGTQNGKDAFAGIGAGRPASVYSQPTGENSVVDVWTSPDFFIQFSDGATITAAGDWYTRSPGDSVTVQGANGSKKYDYTRDIKIADGASVTFNTHHYTADASLYGSATYLGSHVMHLLGNMSGSNVNLTFNNQLISAGAQTRPTDGSAELDVHYKDDTGTEMGFVAIKDIHQFKGDSHITVMDKTVLQVTENYTKAANSADQMSVLVQGKNAAIQFTSQDASGTDKGGINQYVDEIVLKDGGHVLVGGDLKYNNKNGNTAHTELDYTGVALDITNRPVDDNTTKGYDDPSVATITKATISGTIVDGKVTDTTISGNSSTDRAGIQNALVKTLNDNSKLTVKNANITNSIVQLHNSCKVDLSTAVLVDKNSAIIGSGLNPADITTGPQTFEKAEGGEVTNGNVLLGGHVAATENATVSVDTLVALTTTGTGTIYNAGDVQIMHFETTSFQNINVEGDGLTIFLAENIFDMAYSMGMEYIAIEIAGDGQFLLETDEGYLKSDDFVMYANNGYEITDAWVGSGQVNLGENIVASGHLIWLKVPEPTTATLSLLALAGLCARRRRK